MWFKELSVVGYAWWMGGLVLRMLVDYWPISLTLLVATWISIARGGLPEDQQLRSLPSVLFLFPVIVILWGALAHIDYGVRPAIPWRVIVLFLIVVMHGIMSASVIYISRGYRQQAAWLAGLISWFALACILQSFFAVTGRLQPPLL